MLWREEHLLVHMHTRTYKRARTHTHTDARTHTYTTLTQILLKAPDAAAAVSRSTVADRASVDAEGDSDIGTLRAAANRTESLIRLLYPHIPMTERECIERAEALAQRQNDVVLVALRNFQDGDLAVHLKGGKLLQPPRIRQASVVHPDARSGLQQGTLVRVVLDNGDGTVVTIPHSIA
eukprot:m.131869 g.131869  ORF g.131869 m.131869 type:complete len:179 (+) comp14797_c1_seq5:1362-1898(+)